MKPLARTALVIALAAGLVGSSGCAPSVVDVAQMTDQAELAQIAESENYSPELRLAAIERITDQPTLARLAAREWDATRRELALSKLTDPSLLAQMAMNSAKADRLFILPKITDKELLVRMATEDTDLEIQRAAWSAIRDPVYLGKLVREHPVADVRLLAFCHLTDQSVLANLALNPPNRTLRQDAWGQLDQEQLAKLAESGSNFLVRRSAIGRLTDQVALTRIATGGADPFLRRAATARLTDTELLVKLARESDDMGMRRAAARQITDDALLAEIAMASRDYKLRTEAAFRIFDGAVHARVGPWLDPDATSELGDQDLLRRIALETHDPETRQRAVSLLTDQALSRSWRWSLWIPLYAKWRRTASVTRTCRPRRESGSTRVERPRWSIRPCSRASPWRPQYPRFARPPFPGSPIQRNAPRSGRG
ncbi:MAG: hypothetical protein IPK67_16490 [Planctomycetes bacterium]|nr:hypothetical protein [Planctomycetota bacterium]